MSKFSELINGEMPVLVDFYAEWCGPCKTMAPILKQAAGKFKQTVKIIKVDVDKNPKVAQKYKIKGVPTLILFHKGNIIWQQSGVVPLAQLTSVIAQHT